MANIFPDNAKKNLWNGVVDLSADTIKVMLLTSSHTGSLTADEFIDDVSANEVTGTGYTAGGATLASQAVTADTSNHRGKFDAADVTWSTSTITAAWAVVYKDTGTPSTSPIIGEIDFGGSKSSSAGNFTIQWDSAGIAYF